MLRHSLLSTVITKESDEKGLVCNISPFPVLVKDIMNGYDWNECFNEWLRFYDYENSSVHRMLEFAGEGGGEWGEGKTIILLIA